VRGKIFAKIRRSLAGKKKQSGKKARHPASIKEIESEKELEKKGAGAEDPEEKSLWERHLMSGWTDNRPTVGRSIPIRRVSGRKLKLLKGIEPRREYILKKDVSGNKESTRLKIKKPGVGKKRKHAPVLFLEEGSSCEGRELGTLSGVKYRDGIVITISRGGNPKVPKGGGRGGKLLKGDCESDKDKKGG